MARGHGGVNGVKSGSVNSNVYTKIVEIKTKTVVFCFNENSLLILFYVCGVNYIKKLAF